MLFVLKLPVILTDLFLMYKEICLNWNRHANIFIYLHKVSTLHEFAILNIKKYIYFITEESGGGFFYIKVAIYIYIYSVSEIRTPIVVDLHFDK